MNRLRAIEVENFRAFADSARLELRPLTLVYGLNGVGKSTLVRLPGIISDSIAESARAPIDLAGEAGGNAAFLDVLSDPALRLCSLTLSWDSGLSARWRLYFDDQQRLIRVGALRIEGGGEPFLYRDPRAAVVLDPEETATRDQLAFDGLVPRVEGASGIAALEQLHSALLELRGHIQWLGAVRARPLALTVERGARPRLGGDGREALEVLLGDLVARKEVVKWFASVNRDLQSQEVQPRLHRWLLPPKDGFNPSIGLVDAGEGWIQVLPILTALAMRRRTSTDGLRLVAVEEPTTHLHDDIQIAMADHLAQLAAEADPVTVLCETHARPLLLGIQLAVAEGRLDPRCVALHWIEQGADGRSHIRLVELDARGLPSDDTIQHAFAHELALLHKLAQAQRRRPSEGR